MNLANVRNWPILLKKSVSHPVRKSGFARNNHSVAVNVCRSVNASAMERVEQTA